MQGLGTEPAAGVLKYFEDRMRARNTADAQEGRSKTFSINSACTLHPGRRFSKNFFTPYL
jgi:hypothetical protein